MEFLIVWQANELIHTHLHAHTLGSTQTRLINVTRLVDIFIISLMFCSAHSPS